MTCSAFALTAAALMSASSASAQTDGAAGAVQQEAASSRDGDLGDIVVTAQKRSETASDVPMSITAATGDQLLTRGIQSTADLAKLVPGFAATESGTGTPVYFLRGIGFFESSLAAKPTVGLYTDEQPIPFPALARGNTFDLERVEVLKGPQGTLFGQNATGGAINYIAAKPTNHFAAGFNASYGRFNEAELSGFVSGRLSDTLKARVAVQGQSGGDWQYSYTRGERLGAKRFIQGRLLLDWDPADTVRVSVNVNGFRDKSDVQAGQLATVFQLRPALPPVPELLAYPLAPDSARAADWGTTFPQQRNDKLMQANLRAEFDLSDAVTLTSLSSYTHFDEDYGQDADATSLVVQDLAVTGKVRSFNQELRLSGHFGDKGNWLFGGNYSNDKTSERHDQRFFEQTSARVFGAVRPGPVGRVLTPTEITFLQSIGATFLPDDRVSLQPTTLVPQIADTDFETVAAFANADFEIVDGLTIQGGIRYTETKIDFAGCAINDGNQSFATGTSLLLGLTAGSIPLGSCATLDNGAPALVKRSLTEDNVSWRVGLDWKVAGDNLIYANVSRGYKAGGFPLLPATQAAQYTPVTQESVTAYEAGFKVGLGRVLNVNGAAFYYDYKDKQLKGNRVVPIFGPLEGLVNVPKSRVQGVELQVLSRPFTGFTINGGVTYIDSKVTGSFENYTPFGVLVDYKDVPFPYTPKWQSNLDLDYRWAVGGALEASVGSTITYRSRTRGVFAPGPYTVSAANPVLSDDAFGIIPYTLLDLRASLGSVDDRWKVSIYGRNVTDKYYWNFVGRRGDQIVRFAGMPVTYGMSLSYRF
jgi:outer membrane receptor protein involved in Fe transport